MKENGLFYCPVCSKKAAVWQCDFSNEDTGREEPGIMAMYECSNCGAEIEAFMKEAK